MSDAHRLREKVEEENARREELRSEIPFKRCLQTKEIGEFYRNRTLADVYTEFDLTRSKVRNTVADYVKLVNYPTDQVPPKSILVGVSFYGRQKTLAEITEETESSEEEVQKFIREFVAVTLAEQNQEIDLRSETIPENAQYPPSVTATVSNLHKTILHAKRQVSQSFTPVMAQMSSRIQEMKESFRPVIESLRKLARQVREAIEHGISNFESPSDYEPDSIQLNTLAQTAGREFLNEVLESIKQEEDHPLEPYQDRIEVGFRDFRNDQFFTPTFVFISVQDGMMHLLCKEDGVSPDYSNRFGDPVYEWDTKRGALARLNQEWYGVSTGNFIRNLEAFYAHRNAIMHGDPVAYFDENIATISMLFLAMTLDTVLEYDDSGS